jgi:ribosomal protein S18 acetylase RimI-like enzyme
MSLQTSVLLRPAEVADSSAIARIHVAGWQSAYRDIVADEHLDSLSIDQRQAFWKQQLHHDPCLLYVAEDAVRGIVGFAYAGAHHGNFREFRGEIHAIYVLDQFQRHGIGRQLFFHAAAALQQAEYPSMMVWALKQNPYRKFYERLGGKLLGEEVTCIGNRELVQVAYGWPEVSAVVPKAVAAGL